MRTFDHIGLRTFTPQPGERFVQKTRVWVTDPHLHPFRVEWLRYEADSTVSDELKDAAHLAWHVDSIEEESRGLAELIAPFYSVAGHRVGFYRTADGAVVELMEY
ncbi:MAG TPA: hypothetical protein VLA21_04260 [Candidatus Limnocylindria bacterium]|nr:hypothetical protein [Candidatus Limnocylindria bacterium]